MTGRGSSWSRRKAAVAAEARERERAAADARDAEARAAVDRKPDDEVLAELNLPHPDTLQRGDDFSAFLSDAVPERLRRRALRRLWRSNPVLANVDSLVDYGDDFTDGATVIENIRTAYRIGRGMLSHLDAVAEAPAAEGTPAAADGRRPVAETAAEPDADCAEARSEGGADEPRPQPPRRRRMRFAFAETGRGPAAAS